MPTGFRNRRILLYDLQKGADSFQQFRSNDDIRSKFIANGKCSEKTCGFIKTVCGTKHSPIGSFPENFGAERRYQTDRKSTRLNSSHANISYAVFCLKKKKRNK